ncbi:hypothetical protein HBI38_104460 [Parastagonospora nodorum]|nr:hypothetical protein HBI38_104460 [Parastagonospora nodorum]
MMLEAPRLFNVGIVHGYPELVRATPNPIVGSSPGWVNGTSSQRAVGTAIDTKSYLVSAKLDSMSGGPESRMAKPRSDELCRSNMKIQKHEGS